MADESTGSAAARRVYRRILGEIDDGVDGPTILVTAGIHGNELAGIVAAERLVDGLGQRRSRLHGRVVCIAGNLQALQQGSRFVDCDLNRQWTPEQVVPLLDGVPSESEPAEHAEQRALIDLIGSEVRRARGPVFFIDLHTSSADGPPFMTVGDTLLNRKFSSHFPLPAILGLEEQVDGSLLEFLNNYGFVTLGVEGGRHDSPASADRLEALLKLALVATGVLEASEGGDLMSCRDLLAGASRDVPRVIEVRRRHAVEPADGFRMAPGFANFKQVRRGQLLAEDVHGDVTCPEDGLILLPLYQGQGDDGFFVARRVHPFWLTVSAVLRRLGLTRVVSRLPGVRRDERRPGALRVDTRVARFYPLDLFHLFGYRKLRSEGSYLIVSRRTHDMTRPPRIEFP